jgi:hypothetical protein
MNRLNRPFRFCLPWATIAFLAGTLAAQPSRKEPIRLQQDVKPAFRVKPIVHRFEARRGTTIPFEFELESIKRATSVRIRTVAMTQDHDGTIIPDTETPPPDNITLLSAAAIDLEDNQTTILRGRVKVPFSDSKFHSFGILVTDLGKIVGTRTVRGVNNEERRVGVRFVTRYLLRCDIEVSGARGGNIKALQIDSCELFEVDGNAHARVWLENPTDSPFEFQLRSRLARPNHGSRQRSFYLAMPVRHNTEPPERWTIRLLPGARVRVSERLPEAVFPGEYEMQVELVTKGRTRIRKEFPVSIQSGDFPGQDATIVQVARDITVTPAQVELSLQRGGKRYVPLEVANTSRQKINVILRGLSATGEALDWLTIRPTEISLTPGAKRKVLVSMTSAKGVELHSYGAIRVSAKAEEGKAIGQFDVTVGLLARSEQMPNIELGELEWDGKSDPPAFVVEVGNTGAMHFPMDASLNILNAFGRPVTLQAGYGQWLLPGQSSQLRFPTKFAPPAAEYQYKLELNHADNATPTESAEGTVRID